MIVILNHCWSAWEAKFNIVSVFVLLSGLFNLKTKYDESDNVMVRASRVVTDKLQDIFSKWTVIHPAVTTYYYSLKYFPASDCLKPHSKFTIISGCWPNLERILSYWTDEVKRAAHCRLLNQWGQNDVKSATRCRLLNWWPRNLESRLSYFWWAEKQRVLILIQGAEFFISYWRQIQ